MLKQGSHRDDTCPVGMRVPSRSTLEELGALTENIQLKLEELACDASLYLDDLEIALVLLSQVALLFNRLDEKQKNTLLQILLKGMVINENGEILSFELHSPFNYLHSLAGQSEQMGEITNDNFMDVLDFSSRTGLEEVFPWGIQCKELGRIVYVETGGVEKGIRFY